MFLFPFFYWYVRACYPAAAPPGGHQDSSCLHEATRASIGVRIRRWPVSLGCPPSSVSAPWSTLKISESLALITVSATSTYPARGCPSCPARRAPLEPGGGLAPRL